MNETATPIRPVAAPVLADARSEVQRIEVALAELDTELAGLDLGNHIGTLNVALDAAIDSGAADAISKAAQALQAAKTECDAQGTARMVATGRQRSLRAQLVHARVALQAAEKEELRAVEARLSRALAAAFAEYEAMLNPLVAAHLRVAFLADRVWAVRADLIGVKKVNWTVPVTSFALPVPNGAPLPCFPVNTRLESRLQRNVDLAAPPAGAFGQPSRQWSAADRALVESIRAEVEEVSRG